MKKNDKKQESKMSKETGLERNVASALCYSLGIVTGILFLVLENEDKTVRFHAIQSILATLVATIVPPLLVMSIIGILFVPFWGIFTFFTWIYLMYKAYIGEEVVLPVIGKLAKDNL